jgi:hypothetical protein
MKDLISRLWVASLLVFANVVHGVALMSSIGLRSVSPQPHLYFLSIHCFFDPRGGILSAVSQQIQTIQVALKEKAKEVELIGKPVKVHPDMVC